MKFKPDSVCFTFLLAALASLPPLSTDVYLSALSVIGESLGGTPSSAGFSISIFLGCFAISQLIFGPLADRLGRRPVGGVGCVIYTVSSFGCTFAQSIGSLLAWRALQGIGAGGVCMLAFAIVRDLFHGKAARTRFAYVNATRAFAPMIAPIMGSWIYQLAGWRATLGVVALFGIGLTAAFGFGFEESLPPNRHASISPKQIVRNYWCVLTNRSTLGFSLVNAAVCGAILSFITGSSFVFVDLLGISRPHFGAILFCTASGVMLGSAVAGKLAGISDRKVSGTSLAMHLTATGSLLLLSLTHRFTPQTAVPLLMMMTFSAGLMSAGTVHSALAPMGRLAGTASAIFGCLGMIGGSMGSAMVSLLNCNTPTKLTAVMVCCSMLAILSYVTLAIQKEDALAATPVPEEGSTEPA